MSTQQPHARRLVGKVALVTAATAGIGLGIARRLGQEGAQVVICSRKQQNVDESLQQLQGEGIEAEGMACHVANAEQRRKLVQMAAALSGKIDVVVCNAAVNPFAGPILDIPSNAIDKIFDINIKSAVLLLKEAQPYLPRGASIIFISSITAFNPQFPIAMYAVSKTALLGLAKGLAVELGPRGIRVNCVAPGIVPTKFASYLVQDQELRQAQINSTLLKRLGSPEDMAAATAFLASGDSEYITGETIVVAGGMQSRL